MSCPFYYVKERRETGQTESLGCAVVTGNNLMIYEQNGFLIEVKQVITILQAPPTRADVYDLDAAATYLSITRRKMRELFAAKKVRGVKIDYRTWVFTQEDLDEFLLTYRQQPKRIR